jgi:hypothetical protein
LVDESQQRKILSLREDAQRLLNALGSAEFPDNATARDLRARLEQAATDVERAAAEPITLGVVGEFSVGKSLLLGTLMGKPDLLPVDDRPTTGNVTALYLRSGGPDEPTRIDGDPEIQYMTGVELSACVQAVLSHLVGLFRDVLRTELAELDGYDPLARGWDPVTKVCRRLWAPGSSRNPEILKTATELLAIRAAHRSGEDLLGMPVVVADDRVRRAGLELAAGSGVPDEYPDFPVRTGLTRTAVQGDDEALRITFPLIRRVAYKVVVNSRLWPLNSLHGHGGEIVLLDFPGLTASRSALRDEYLSSFELRNVHTILSVADARKPDNQTPHKLHSMLERHGRGRPEMERSILAIGNRFDEVPAPDSLPVGPVTFAAVRAATDKVGRFADTARAMVGSHEKQVVLVSAVAGISHYEYSVSSAGEELRRMTQAVAAAPKSMSAWGEVGARLSSSEPRSHWAAVFTEYGKDGGIAALRLLIEDHAAKNGLANKLGVVGRLDKDMRDLLPQVELMIAVQDATVSEAKEAREALTRLFSEFRSQQERMLTAAARFRDPLGVRLRDGTPLLDSVRDSTVRGVFGWQQWQAVMQRTTRGFVDKKAGQDGTGTQMRTTARWGKLRQTDDDTTRAFLDSYVDTYTAAAGEARAGLKEAVLAWIDDLNGELAHLRDQLADPVISRYLDLGLARLEEAERLSRRPPLEALADLRLLLQAEDEDAEPVLLTEAVGPHRVQRGEIVLGYPLYLSEDGARGAALPWNSAVPEAAGDADQRLVRHQVYMFRLRRQLAMGLTDALASRVAHHAELFYQALREQLVYAATFVPDSTVLERMFPPEPPAAAGEPDEPEPTEPGGSADLRDLLHEWKQRAAENA